MRKLMIESTSSHRSIIYFLLILIFCFPLLLQGQALGIKSFSGSSPAVFSSFCRTDDGGFLAVGYMQGSGGAPVETALEGSNYDALVVKFNSFSEIEWQKTYGKDGDDLAYSITATEDGNYIVVGETYSFGAQKDDMLIFKINSNGTLLWARKLGGSDEDWAVDVKQDNDGGYLILGNNKGGATCAESSSGYQVVMLELDENGYLLWQKSYDGDGDEIAYALMKTTKGEFLAAGSTTSFGNGSSDGFVMKTDGGGVIKWQKFYGTSQSDYLYFLGQAADGGYLAVGETSLKERGTESNAWAVRLDDNGGDNWQRAYGNAANDYALGLTSSGKHGFIIVGGSAASSTQNESWALKVDWSGKPMWRKRYNIGSNGTLFNVRKFDGDRLLFLGKSGLSDSAYPFIASTDKRGSVGTCSVIDESSISNKWISSGSGIASFVVGDPALTMKGLMDDISVGSPGLSGESVCPPR